MQTILGSGGIIADEVARTLPQFTQKVRLVSRNPKKVNETDELFSCDLINSPKDVEKAVEGSEVVYLTVGLPYSTKVWEASWLTLMRNVVNACKKHHAKLVFFDNIYMYDPNYLTHLTEETPFRPVSRKGKVRQEVAQLLINEVEQGNLTALIARAPDFYGPNNKTSVLVSAAIEPLSQGKKANWFHSLEKKHAFIYTPDAGKATAILGNTPDSFNQTWHLPTDSNILSGKEWIEAIAKELNVQPKSQVAGQILTRIIGLFNPIMKEFVEMLYQWENDYFFDSSKFEKRFDFKPTPYLEGLKETIRTDFKH